MGNTSVLPSRSSVELEVIDSKCLSKSYFFLFSFTAVVVEN